MARRFGRRNTFAVEVGVALSSHLRVVDLWAAGVRITAYDNAAYVPSLCHYMCSAAVQVRQGRIRPRPFPAGSPEKVLHRLEADVTDFQERYRFMRWSEIVDNVSSYAHLDDKLVIVFAFRRTEHSPPEDRGKVFVTRIPPEDFVTTLLEAADLLEAEPVG